jgi:hypothetical protein
MSLLVFIGHILKELGGGGKDIYNYSIRIGPWLARRRGDAFLYRLEQSTSVGCANGDIEMRSAWFQSPYLFRLFSEVVPHHASDSVVAFVFCSSKDRVCHGFIPLESNYHSENESQIQWG